MKPQYVIGLLFDDTGKNVVLIRKNKPSWQNGLLNAPGGKVEQNEKPHEAVRRELLEEIGVEPLNGWKHFCTMSGNEFDVYCYRANDSRAYDAADTKEKEVVFKVNVWNLFRKKKDGCVSNLQWLIKLAQDSGVTISLVSYD